MAMSRQSLPPVNQYTGSYTEDVDGDGVRLNAFDHDDASIAYDPLSANRRFPGAADLAVLGTLVFAGPTCHSISVMVPDCLLPPVDNMVRIDLRHHVGLSLGPAVDMTHWSPEAHLDRALCPGPLLDTLELQRRDFWAELNPILKQWKCVNGSKCPDCGELIKINMGRHIRLKHTTFQCFWRCPVLSCSLCLCIASSSLLSVLDPLPLDRLSRHTVDEISLWPAADRHAILAVANRDVRVARQNIAEMMLYVDDHAAHLANCASASDDSLTLMSTELIPRLEGGIRAVLDEAANL